MTIRFIAVTNGHRADGYLIAHGDIYVARSGRLLDDTAPGKKERGEVPPGTYNIGKAMDLSAENKLTMTDGSKDTSYFRKFAIMPTGSNTEVGTKGKLKGVKGVRDTRYPGEPRTLLRFHYDGDRPGSEGCIVYDDKRAQESIAAAVKAGDSMLIVTYVKDQNEVRAQVQQHGGGAPVPRAS